MKNHGFAAEAWDRALIAYGEATEPQLAPLATEALSAALREKLEGDVQEVVHFAFSADALAAPSQPERVRRTAAHLFSVLAPSDANSPLLSGHDEGGREWFAHRVESVLDILDPEHLMAEA